MGETLAQIRPSFNRSIRIEGRPERLTAETGALLLREGVSIPGKKVQQLPNLRTKVLKSAMANALALIKVQATKAAVISTILTLNGIFDDASGARLYAFDEDCVIDAIFASMRSVA